MLVGVLGLLLWLIVWAPRSWRRDTTYRRRSYREAPLDEVPPGAVPPTRGYPAGTRYEDHYEEEYRR